MPATFPGFPKEGLQFLKDLAKNNDREWFQANKKTYDTAIKSPMVALVEAVNVELAAFAKDYRADPKKAIGRINRDTRFSSDKSPYKTEVSAVFPRAGKEKEAAAGFYFSVRAGGIEMIGGIYVPGPEQLAKLRARFAKDHATFRKLVANKQLQALMGSVQGEQLKRVPREYDADHPAGDLLRYKQVFLQASLPAATAVGTTLLPELTQRFKVMTPFVEYLDAAIS